jgi:hypothetical protein
MIKFLTHVSGLVVVGALLVASGGPVGAARPAFTGSTAMDADGWGPFRIGQSVRSAEKRWGKQVVHLSPEAFDGTCWYVAPLGEGTPYVMINAESNGDPDDGIVVRIESSASDAKRPIVVKGMRAGVSKASVLKLFPAAKRTPHEYTDGSYLDVTLKKNRVVRFVSGDDRVVDNIIVGNASAVQYVEGCA